MYTILRPQRHKNMCCCSVCTVTQVIVFLTPEPDVSAVLEQSWLLLRYGFNVSAIMFQQTLTPIWHCRWQGWHSVCVCVCTHQDRVHSHVDPANTDHQTPAESQAEAQRERVLWRRTETSHSCSVQRLNSSNRFKVLSIKTKQLWISHEFFDLTEIVKTRRNNND